MQRSGTSKTKTSATTTTAASAGQQRRSVSKTAVKRNASQLRTVAANIHQPAGSEQQQHQQHQLHQQLAAAAATVAATKRTIVSSSSSNLIGNIPIERKMGMTNLCASRNPLNTRELGGRSGHFHNEFGVQRIKSSQGDHYNRRPFELDVCPRMSKTNDLRSISRGLQRAEFQQRFYSESQTGGGALPPARSMQTARPTSFAHTTAAAAAAAAAAMASKPAGAVSSLAHHTMKGVQSVHVPSNKSMPYLKTNTSSCLNSVRIVQQRPAAVLAAIPPPNVNISKTAYGVKTQQSSSGGTGGGGGKPRDSRILSSKKSTNNSAATRSKLATEIVASTKFNANSSRVDTARRKPDAQQPKTTRSRSTNAHHTQLQLDLSPRKSGSPTKAASHAPKRGTSATTAATSSTTAAEAVKVKWDSSTRANRAASKTATATNSKTTTAGRSSNYKSLTDSNRTYTINSKAPTTTSGTVGGSSSRADHLEIVNALQIPRLEGGGISRAAVLSLSQLHLNPTEFLSSSTIETGDPSSEFLNTLCASDTSLDSFIELPSEKAKPQTSSVSTYGISTTSGESFIDFRNQRFRRCSSTSNNIFPCKPSHVVSAGPAKSEVQLVLHEEKASKIKSNNNLATKCIRKASNRRLNKSKTYLESLIPPNDQDVAKYNKMKIQQRRDAIWKEWVKNQSRNQSKNPNSAN